jgi:hypothetical protein
MEQQNLVILSTAHLHPLEAAKIDEYAYVGNKECALVNTSRWFSLYVRSTETYARKA